MMKRFLVVIFILIHSLFFSQRSLPSDTIWVFPIGRDIMMNPLMEDDQIYCGSGKGKLFCLNAKTGTSKWEFQGSSERKAGIYHGIKASKKSLFYNNGNNLFYCIDKATGKMNWQFTARFDDDILTNIILADKSVIFSGNDTVVNCLDQSSGKIIWQYKHTSVVSPVEGNEKQIFFTTGDSLFICLDSKSGKENWKIPLRAKPEALKVCISGNTAAFVSKYGKVELIDLEKRKAAGTIDPCNKPKEEFGDRRIPYSYNDYLFIHTGEGIKCYDFKGELKWTYPGEFDWYLEPTVYKNKFYVYGRRERKLIILDLKTGKELYSRGIDGKTYTKLLVNDKFIFMGMGGKYFAIPNKE